MPASSPGCGVAPPEELPLVLVDYTMPVGITGIVFVAALEARVTPNGPIFSTIAIQAAYRRAGSTLAHMALVSGPTFAFLRTASTFTQAEAATFLGVPTSTIEAWENGSVPVPTNTWYLLADKVCAMDGREFCPYLTLPNPSFRARRIRVHPDVPRPSQLHIGPPPC